MGGGMQNAWERRVMHVNLLQENLKERNYLEDLGITSKLRGAEPFLRSRKLCSYPRTSQHFMELGKFITVFTRALH
jgi:hypothetical protein